MKILILIVSLFFSPIQDETIKNIGAALKAGSSKELMNFCNETVEIKLNGKSSNYSKAQAEVLLKDFFSKNSPKDFTYIHQGSSQGLQYSIGRYTHENGTYRIVMFIKKTGNKYLINTLNFSK